MQIYVQKLLIKFKCMQNLEFLTKIKRLTFIDLIREVKKLIYKRASLKRIEKRT